MKFNFKKILPELLVILAFIVLSIGYMSPILNGKQLMQSDPKAFYATQSELRHFKEATGEWTGWTNSLFGGMPTYFIGGEYGNSIFFKIQLVVYPLFGLQGTYIFLYLLCAYILLRALKVNRWVAILGSIAYGFYSLNIIIIEAGHLAKIYALAFVPLMLAGALLMYQRKKLWLGVVLFSFGVGMEVNANHFQITYYAILILLILGISELIKAFKDGRIGSFALATVLAIVMAGLAAATNTARLWTTADHSKYTNRGGSEYIKQAVSDKQGLEKDYAYNFSNGVLETLSHLIPDIKGGASAGGRLDDKSETYATLTQLGVPPAQALNFSKSLPTYYGSQLFSGGPSYSSAIIIFLFILGLLIGNRRYTIPFGIAAFLTLSISWGGNFRILNDLWFDYLPLFNKFRAHSQATSLFQLCVVIIACLGLNEIFQSDKSDWLKFKKPFFISLGVAAGLCLIVALFAGSFSTVSSSDESLRGSLAQSFGNNTENVNRVMNSLMDDRAGLAQKDAWRSLIFILLAASILWLWMNKKIKSALVVGLSLSTLVLIDLWSIDKRYLNEDDFQRKTRNLDGLFVPSAADQQILADKDPDFRVLDVTSSPFTNATTSYFHKSIGGYHSVKLSRYADIVENQISKNNMRVLNMLNTKYFIVNNPNGGGTMAQQNPNALGNAWFVSQIKTVDTANQEMDALDSLNVANTAVVDAKFSDTVNNSMISTDTTGDIKLTEYKPNKLTYQFESPSDQTVIFSEIYYKGNEDWISTIDGKQVDHFRANYILRGLQIPKGKHEIVFEFKPQTVIKGRKIDTYTSWAWVVMSIVILGIYFVGEKNKKISNND